MSNYASLYWLTRLDSIRDCLQIVGSIGLFGAFAVGLFILLDGGDCLEDSPMLQRLVKWLKWTTPFCLFLLLSTAFIPTRNEVVFIIAGGKTLDYVQSDTSLNKLPYQATRLISEYLDKQVEGIKSSKK